MTRVKYKFNNETMSYHSKEMVANGQVVVASIYITDADYTATIVNYDTGLEVTTTDYNTLAAAKKGLKASLTELGVQFSAEARIRRSATILEQEVA
jgi:hypothetical protein